MPGNAGRDDERATHGPNAETILTVTTNLECFTSMARDEPPMRFISSMGLLTEAEGLCESFERQNGTKAPGVDGVRHPCGCCIAAPSGAHLTGYSNVGKRDTG